VRSKGALGHFADGSRGQSHPVLLCDHALATNGFRTIGRQHLVQDCNADGDLRRRAGITDSGNDFGREGIPTRRRPVYDSGMIDETAIRARYKAIKDQLDGKRERMTAE